MQLLPNAPSGRLVALLFSLCLMPEPSTAHPASRLAVGSARGVSLEAARYAMESGRFQEAVNVLESALADTRGTEQTRILFSSVAEAHARWAEQLLSEGATNEAISHYEKNALPTWRAIRDVRAEAVTLNNLGHIYSELGEMRKALMHLFEALGIERRLADRSGEAATLNNIGQTYSYASEHGKALEAYEQALAIEVDAGANRELVATLNNTGAEYAANGERWKALGCYEQALTLDDQATDVRTVAGLQNNIGQLYAELGDTRKALEVFKRALLLEETVDDGVPEAATLNNIGQVYASNGDRGRAIEYYERALRIEPACGASRGRAATLDNVAQIHSVLGDVKVAVESYQEALAIRRALNDRGGEWHTLNNLGVTYAGFGETPEALTYLRQALVITRAIPSLEGQTATLTSLGQVHSELGEWRTALEYFLEALGIVKSVEDHDLEAELLNNVGGVYANLGENRKALEYYEQTLSIRRESRNRDGEALALNNLGEVCLESGTEKEALRYFAGALLIERAVSDRVGEANTLHNMGSAYSRLCKRQEALEYFNQALAIEREVGERRGEAYTLSSVGAEYSRLREYRKALEYFDQALPILRTIGDRSGEARVLSKMMLSWEALGAFREAILFGKLSVNVYEVVRRNLHGVDPDLQERYRGKIEDTYRHVADMLITRSRLSEAQEVIGVLKQEEFVKFGRRRLESGSAVGIVDLSEEEAAWEKRYRELGAHLACLGLELRDLERRKMRTPAEETRMREVEREVDLDYVVFQTFLKELEAAFRRKRTVFDGIANVAVTATTRAVLRDLGPGVVVLYTVVGEERYQIFLVTANGIGDAHGDYSITAPDLNRKILAFREVLQDPRADPKPLAKELYRILVAPIAGALSKAKAETLMWSLDGALRYIPISALYDGGHYLLEKYRNVLFTQAHLDALRSRPLKRWTVAAMGVSEAAEGFPALRCVPGELEGIAGRSGKADGVLPGSMKLNGDFTEAALSSSLAKGDAVIHIASHFALHPGDETESFLLLGGGERRRLSVADIKGYNFAGVDLLTLSACDTAMTLDADGREMDGLAMTVQAQGARAVVATLWEVADESTGPLMVEFYRLREAGSGMPKGEALRQAQKDLLKRTDVNMMAAAGDKACMERKPGEAPGDFSHPYYWAPFVLIGNWQ
jgi:CHAT domain-containing protein/tetratricopeptide (TPR) repeat protein